jgi:hypothetical protein
VISSDRVELPEGVLAVRAGPGANCSSIGSVVDMLFAAAVLSGVVYAGVVASLADREFEQVGRGGRREGDAREGDDEAPR